MKICLKYFFSGEVLIILNFIVLDELMRAKFLLKRS